MSASSMTEMIFSCRLWQHWLVMLFIGSNPKNGGGSGFMLGTVWDWYGPRENITSPWAGVSLSASNPYSLPKGLLAKKVPGAFHLQRHVYYTAGKAERRLLIMFGLSCCLSLSVSFPDSLFLFLSKKKKSKSDFPNRKQARKGQSSGFHLPTRPDTSVRTCQEWLKWGGVAMTTARPLCHLHMPCGRGEGNAFLITIGVFSHLAVQQSH